jgi:hypothetical protein
MTKEKEKEEEFSIRLIGEDEIVILVDIDGHPSLPTRSHTTFILEVIVFILVVFF